MNEQVLIYTTYAWSRCTLQDDLPERVNNVLCKTDLPQRVNNLVKYIMFIYTTLRDSKL